MLEKIHQMLAHTPKTNQSAPADVNDSTLSQTLASDSSSYRFRPSQSHYFLNS